ncbi:TrmB family transcriptional regulator [Citrobacter amalonaticus]|uniref:TrmB family transcriptional regulator n=1 Tax=Citrobacter amalonaticus TaxID=35703 RepID=UPI00388E41B6
MQIVKAEATVVLRELSTNSATVGEIVENMCMSQARCQFILTQRVMANYSIYQFGCYKRLQ